MATITTAALPAASPAATPDALGPISPGHPWWSGRTPSEPSSSERIVGHDLPTRAVQARRHARDTFWTLLDVRAGEPTSKGTVNGGKLWNAYMAAAKVQQYAGKGMRGDTYTGTVPPPLGTAFDDTKRGYEMISQARVGMHKLLEPGAAATSAELQAVAAQVLDTFQVFDAVVQGDKP